MKTFLTALLLCIFHFNCTAQWVELNVGNTTATYFSDVYAITPDIVVVVGDNGTILKTTDGGTTWQQKDSGTTLNLGHVEFPTSNIGYVTAANGKLLKTTDGGETWTTIDLGTNTIFLSLSCVNENLIFLSGINADPNPIILKSIDGGISWETTIQTNPQITLYDIQFLSGEVGFASNDYYPSSYTSNILRTEDGGKNWITLDNSRIPFNFINENIGFYYRGGLYKTIDAGNTFSNVLENSEELRCIYAVNEFNIWGILAGVLNGDGSTRGITKITSSDSDTYTETIAWDNNKEIDMTSIHFADENTGYIIGTKNGKATVWKNGTGINTPDSSMGTIDKTLISFKVYPNPTSDKINIVVNNQFPKEFTIILSDISGKQVYNQNFTDKKEVSINAQNFSKGTYILTIKSQKQAYSQKLIIQ